MSVERYLIKTNKVEIWAQNDNYYWNGHLKRSRMAQVSALLHISVRSYESG